MIRSHTILKYILTSILLAIPSYTLAQEPEITEEDKQQYCHLYKSGEIEAAREYAVEQFGSLEKFYKNFHRIQCPPDHKIPSPLYLAIKDDPLNGQIIKEFENWETFLTSNERKRILNRIDEVENMTVLDVFKEYKHQRNEEDRQRREVNPLYTRRENPFILVHLIHLDNYLDEFGALRADDLDR